MKRKFEVLAPAGSPEAFYAVADAGADAVYVGGTRFGARAFAENFSQEQLLEALDYAHIRNRKVYLTINTLFKNPEMGQLYEYLLPYYENGLDAVIVQDFGVLRFVAREFPELPIHASTQMTITGVPGAALLKKAGAKRIVCAREMGISEISQIHEHVDIEIEAFVHGALCYCYSGQCLMSSMIGGRSGNRGRCAQPCRLAYAVCGLNCKKMKPESFLLSPKDLCAIQMLPQLYEAGVHSLKIEGRMKQAQYAAGVTSIYRKYADLAEEGMPYHISDEDYQVLLGLGNRSGFTSGYFQKHNGTDMITFDKPAHTKAEIARPLAPAKSREAVIGHLILKKGRPAVFRLIWHDFSAASEGKTVLPAQNSPLCLREVRERMQKTGDTPFCFQSLTIDMESDVFLPNSALNQLRRDAFSKLKTEILRPYRRKKPDFSGAEPQNFRLSAAFEPADTELVAATENRMLLPILCDFPYLTTIYLDSQSYERKRLVSDLKKDIRQIHLSGKKAFFMLPMVFRRQTAEYYGEISPQIKESLLDGFVVRTYDELQFLQTNFPEYPFVMDHNLYTLNDWAVNAFYEYHPQRDTLPLELNRQELFQRIHPSSEWIVYGYYPLMVSAQCVCQNTEGCKRQPKLLYLKDRYGKLFPVKNNCGECYNVIYNSLPVMLFPFWEDGSRMGVRAFRLSFTIESQQQTKEILRLFEEFQSGTRSVLPPKLQEQHTNGHYKRGVE